MPYEPTLSVCSGQPQVVDRAGRAREVVDEVDRLVDPSRLRQVVVARRRTRRRGCARCSRATRSRGCRRRSRGALLEQRVAEVRAEEAGAAGDDRGWHRADHTHGQWAPSNPYEFLTIRPRVSPRAPVSLSTTPPRGPRVNIQPVPTRRSAAAEGEAATRRPPISTALGGVRPRTTTWVSRGAPRSESSRAAPLVLAAMEPASALDALVPPGPAPAASLRAPAGGGR